MGGNVVSKSLGETTVIVEEKLKSMCQDGNKLHHLQCSQMLFPPEILLISRSKCSHHIIKVHDDVDERIEKAKEGGMATGKESGSGPHRHRHNAMVNYVKRRHLVELFPGDKTKRVNKLEEFAEVVDIATM